MSTGLAVFRKNSHISINMAPESQKSQDELMLWEKQNSGLIVPDASRQDKRTMFKSRSQKEHTFAASQDISSPKVQNDIEVDCVDKSGLQESPSSKQYRLKNQSMNEIILNSINTAKFGDQNILSPDQENGNGVSSRN